MNPGLEVPVQFAAQYWITNRNLSIYCPKERKDVAW